ncbi:hypothetical protein AQUCO_01600323v1 [Aquilegia coerulea]|uniref:Peptidase A1 domain-containing protein n=1 Tax=Aquilegia coerulea TaxID=218851 RepID=A0A2G5DR29_AQUCA|nr:hypothetical protein AQUCO_01600323v1 [Aquilegia coerulea]
MAERTPLLLLPLILSIFVSIGFQQVQCFEHKAVLSLQRFQWKELKHVSVCLPQQSRKEKGATILEMKRKDYCSGQIKNWDETLQNRLVSDESRVKALQTQIKNKMSSTSRITGLSSSTQIPLKSGINLQSLNYIVTVELGGKKVTLLVDTGSDLTWIQCQPCVSCFDQQDPLFNPNMSQSYRTFTCNSSTCQTLSMSTGNPGVCGTDRPTCNYMVSYGDGSYSRGELAREYLNLTADTAVPNFIFGCGRNNKGLFGGTSGILGLGRSQVSLISQTSRRFNGIFSYCLPDNEDPSSLILGENSSVYKNSTPITYTRMLLNPQLSNFYLLNLTGMTVGGVNLQAPGFNNSGIILDSGTIITRLVPSVYRALRTEFLKQFSGYPPAPAFSILDTCFNLTGYEELEIPVIKFGFEGSVQMTVDVMGMFYFVKADASQVCLAIASLSYEDEIGLIGNWQQRNQRIVYDTKKSKLGIAKEICN